MRTLSAALIAELGLTITRPGYLVFFDFTTPAYWSSIGDVTYDGNNYVAADIRVEGLVRDGGASNSARISHGNTDVVGATVLTEGVSDKTVTIFAVYAGATATADVVQEFSGVGDAAEVGERVTISLIGQASQAAFAPRRRIGPATGFNVLLPVGARLTMGGEIYTLERF